MLLEPGVHMDYLIGKHIFGYTQGGYPDGRDEISWAHWYDEKGEPVLLRSFSGFTDAAMEVVDYLLHRDYEFELFLDVPGDGKYVVFFHGGPNGDSFYNPVYKGKGTTIAEAICRAALATKEYE